MRKLLDSYWDRFLTKNSDGKLVRNGVLFEELIEKLLILSYPAEWIRTPGSHDYNRDFYITTSDQKIWAECKNHNNDIALDTIAPTLVMAQIFAVNTIIFFSYSLFNLPARRKIYAYGMSSNKQVYIVDESKLDDLIIQYKDYLPAALRPQNCDIMPSNETDKKCIIDFQFVPSPIIGATIEDRLILPIPRVEAINYNGMFEILVYCEPNVIDNNYKLQITVDEEDRSVNDKYELLDATHSELTELNISRELCSSSGWIERILIRSRIFESTMVLPMIRASVFYGNNQVISKKTPYKKVKHIWAQQVPLIGEKYRELIFKLEYQVLQRGEIGCWVVFGKSGVGKTRLLKESLSVLLRYRYKVVSFIGNDTDSANTILKEIIYFVYEVPREEIFQHLENSLQAEQIESLEESTSIKAYHLTRKISKHLTDKELLDLIDKYFDTLYEKISSEHIAIVIDNLQFFSEPLVYFLQKYILYAKHQTRVNKSVILLSINTDYINSYTQKFLALVKEIEKDHQEFVYEQIDGFVDMGQALIFIRHLLNIKDNHSDAQLKTIAQKASLIPYCIYQAIYSLIDKHIIAYTKNNQAHIIDMTKFYEAVEYMPDNIYEILQQRWDFALSMGKVDERFSKIIFSFISLVGYLDREQLVTFQIPKTVVKNLHSLSFLTQDKEKRYIFDHDLVEKFFLDYYLVDYFEIFNYIEQLQLESDIVLYPFFEYYYTLKKKIVSKELIKTIIIFFSENRIPAKLMKGFFEILFKKTWNLIEAFDTNEEWLIYISKLCNAYRNSVGFEDSLLYYERINDKMQNIGYHSFFPYPFFRNYINTYTDILLHLRKSNQAIVFLEKIISKMPLEAKTDNYLALNAMIYNRLMINHREFSSQEHILKRDECLKTSYLFAQKISDCNLKDEFMYLNLSDEGYVYYALKKDKEKLLNIWNKCIDYSPERLPQKTLNYYRKMVQLALINGKLQDAEQYINKIKQYIDKRTYTSEKLVFQLFSSTANTMRLLILDPAKHYAELMKMISDLMLLSKLKGGNKEYDILNLKAIVAFYNHDIQGMLSAFKEAYSIIMGISFTMHLESKKTMIAYNIVYACTHSGQTKLIRELLYNKSDIEISDLINTCLKENYTAEGILCTSDQKFNLPIVV